MSVLAQDLRYALRQLRKSPAFALTAIITLGLGVGVNAAMFSVIEQVILRPLPYPHGRRLVEIKQVQRDGQGLSFSLPDLRDYQARSRSLQGLAFYTVQLPTMGGTENPEVTPQFVTSPNFFEVLGVHPEFGRAFVPSDAQTGHDKVILLSQHAWRKYFHSDRSVVGRSVPINGDPFTVIGVLPASASFPVDAQDEIFSPLNVDDKELHDRNSGALQAIAWLRPGVTPAEAQSELSGIHAQLLREYPSESPGVTIRAVDYHQSITLHSRRALFALNWAVVAVWLIACANVAGLMLTRTNGRRREIAIRGALGADRSRITRQFLTESLLLALAGSAAGLAIAFLALRLLRRFLSSALLYGSDIHINTGVCIFLLAASCLSALLFGLAPALHAAKVPAQEGLREGTAAAGTSKRQALWRDGLVVTEITLTLALLIAAGLMMQTLLSLRRADMGFDTEHVVTGSLYLPMRGPLWRATATARSAPSNLVQSFFAPLREKLRRLPGVEAAGFTTVRPLSPQWNFQDSLKFKDRPQPARGKETHAQVRASTADYYRAMGIRLLAGRLFGPEDGPARPVSVLVNREFVKENFPGENPLGRQVEIADSGPRRWGTIVGVIDDARQVAPGESAEAEMDINLDQLTPADMFYPILVTFHMDLALRARAPLGVLTDAIRRDVHSLEPEVAVQDLQPMQQVVDKALGSQTLAARLLGIFGLAALLIAAAGIYGLLAYSVGQRTRELGVRIALGAARRDILWLILRHALILLAAGIGIGLIVASAAGGVMRSFLYGLARYDALTVILVVLVLGVCGLAASYLPARRAAAIDPVEALRTE